MDGFRFFQVVQNFLKEEAFWQQSYYQFRKRLVEEFVLYLDFVVFLQVFILQLQYGMRLVVFEVYVLFYNSVVFADRLGVLVIFLLVFSSVGFIFFIYYVYADVLCLVKLEEVLRGFGKLIFRRLGGKELEGKGQSFCFIREQLLMNVFLYLRFYVLCKGELDQRVLQFFRYVCQVSSFRGVCFDFFCRELVFV